MMQIESLKGKVSEDEWNLRVELAAIYRLAALYGWTDLVFTHISVRLPTEEGEAEQFLLNPYGLLFEEITASNLIKVDAECNKLSDSPFP
ncbi:MAG: class II aldolase/adducin family protein, partial [Acinetobacter sp.]